MKSPPLRMALSAVLLTTASMLAQERVEQWDRSETTLRHSPERNGYLDVTLRATFTGPDTALTVFGFYDGGDAFKSRFMPALDKRHGSFECIQASSGNHGMVRVSDATSFACADGKRFYPVGTAAYAWIHMKEERQDRTLQSLSATGFNKIRMCAFPKEYDLIKSRPGRYPFEVKERKSDASGRERIVWDFERFEPDFFRHLERRVDDIRRIGIEADLIFFHPYDKGRWGFDAMPRDVNCRYVQYLVTRLSSFRNVWSSVANEWDYVKSKSHDDWEELSKLVVALDPNRHLCSIFWAEGGT